MYLVFNEDMSISGIGELSRFYTQTYMKRQKESAEFLSKFKKIMKLPKKKKITIGFPKPIKKKKTKSIRKALIKELDTLVKNWVKRRDEHICQYCGIYCEGSNCHASHVIPVSHGQHLQFEPLNLKVLCYHHHLNWWHKNPTEAGIWFRQKFPERMEFLDKEKQIKHRWTDEELQNQIELYKTM